MNKRPFDCCNDRNNIIDETNPEKPEMIIEKCKACNRLHRTLKAEGAVFHTIMKGIKDESTISKNI